MGLNRKIAGALKINSIIAVMMIKGNCFLVVVVVFSWLTPSACNFHIKFC